MAQKLKELRTKIWLKAPPGRVWKAVSVGKHLGRWFTKPQTLKLRKGGRWDFVGFPGKVVRVDRGKMVFSHTHRFDSADSRITYRVEKLGKWSVLEVTHDQFGKSGATRQAWEGAWPAILCNLKTYVETGAPMWETFFSGEAA